MSDNSADQSTDHDGPDRHEPDQAGAADAQPSIDFGDAPMTIPPQTAYGQPPAYGSQPAVPRSSQPGSAATDDPAQQSPATSSPAATGQDPVWGTTAPADPTTGYGAADQPTAAYGAPTPPYGAPASSYGAPSQPTQPYGAAAQPTQPYGAPAPQSTPAYGAPSEPAPPHGASTQQYGAASQPTPPYGAPTQPTQPYGAPTQPPAPYAGPAGYPGGPAGPGGPGSSVYGSTVVPDQPKGKGLLIGLIIGGVAVLAIIVVVIALAIGALRGASAGGGDGSDGAPAGEGPSAAAAAAVQGYFDALTSSDAKKALSYLDDTAGLDKTFLTDEVLKVSNELAPITDVEIDTSDVSDYGGYATVDFTVGDNAVSQDMYISVDKKGRAKLTSYSAVQSLYLSQSQFPLELNGVPLTGDSANLFFGMYKLTTANENFTLPNGGEFAVTPLNASLPRSSEVQLTEEARTKVIKTVSDAVTACLAEKTLAAGCGLSLDKEAAGGVTLAEDGVTRSMDEDSLQDLADPTIEISYDTVGVEVTDFGSVDFSAMCTKDGTTAPCELYGAPDFYRVLVDMSGKEWKLTWENF